MARSPEDINLPGPNQLSKFSPLQKVLAPARTRGNRRPANNQRLVLRPSIESEIAFQAAIPRLVVTAVQGDPLLVAHLAAPLEEGDGVGSYRVA